MVIKGKRQIGYEHVLVFIIGLSGYLFTSIIEAISNFSLENTLYLFDHVPLQAQGWRIPLLVLTATLFVDIMVPVFVRPLRDIEFN